MGEDKDDPGLLTVKETSEYLRIPLPTVYYLVQRGQIPAVQIGGRWRIKKNALDRDILKKGDGAKPLILVVDDDKSILSFFSKFLSKYNFRNERVTNAKDALTLLKKNDFQLMFLDLKLPDMDGDVLLALAREINPNLQIIVVTGYPDSRILGRILKTGPFTILQKPIDVEQLSRALKLHGFSPSKRLSKVTTTEEG